MEGKINLFEESQMLGGYSLAVRDDWVFKIKRVHITTREKELYLKEFGEKIITYGEFFDWWCRINKFEKYATNKKDSNTNQL
jgi:hypothetical protein